MGHRIGSTHNKVIVEFLVVPNSPEERIFNSLERKKKDTSKVLDAAEESLGALERLTRKRANALVEERSQTELNFPVAKKPRSTPSALLKSTVTAAQVSSSPA